MIDVWYFSWWHVTFKDEVSALLAWALNDVGHSLSVSSLPAGTAGMWAVAVSFQAQEQKVVCFTSFEGIKTLTNGAEPEIPDTQVVLMLCGSSWTTNSGNAKDATEHVLLPSSPFQFRTGRHFPVSFHFVQVLCRCWSLAEMLWWGFPPLLLCLPAYRFSRSVPLSLYRWPGMVDQWCSHASSFLCSYFLHWSDQNLMVISLDLCLTPPLLILIFAQDFHSSSSTPCTLKQYWKDRIFFWELTSDQWGYDRISCGLERLRFIPTPEICMAPIYQESLLPSWLVPDMQRTEAELTAQTLSLLGMMSSCSCERNGDTEIYIRVWSAKLITRDLFT